MTAFYGCELECAIARARTSNADERGRGCWVGEWSGVVTGGGGSETRSEGTRPLEVRSLDEIFINVMHNLSK